MSIRELHQRVKLIYNKLDSNHNQDFPPALLDMVIDGVINDYIDIFYSGNNFKNYKLGFEVTQQRIDMLSTLVEQSFLQGSIVSGDIVFPFTSLKKPYRNFVRGSLKTTCGIIGFKIFPNGELNSILNDPYQRSSRVWRRVVTSIKGDPESDYDSALIAHSSVDFPAEEIDTTVDLTYIRRPKTVFFGGYNSIDGKYAFDDEPVDSDIPHDYQKSLLPTMVAQELSYIINDTTKFQLLKDKIITLS